METKPITKKEVMYRVLNKKQVVAKQVNLTTDALHGNTKRANALSCILRALGAIEVIGSVMHNLIHKVVSVSL